MWHFGYALVTLSVSCIIWMGLKNENKLFLFTAGVETMLLKMELDPSYFYPTILDALAQVEPGFNGTSSTGTTASRDSSNLGFAKVRIVVDEDTRV